MAAANFSDHDKRDSNKVNIPHRIDTLRSSTPFLSHVSQSDGSGKQDSSTDNGDTTSIDTIKHTDNLLDEWPATSIAGNDILSSILYTLGVCTLTAGRWTPLAFLIVTGGILYPLRRIYTEIGKALPYNGGSLNCMVYFFDDAQGDEESQSDMLPSPLATPMDNIRKSTFTTDARSPTSASPFLEKLSADNLKQIRARSHAEKKMDRMAKAGNGALTKTKLMTACAGTLSLLSYVSTAVVSASSAVSYGAGEFEALQEHVFPLTFLVLAFFAFVTLAGVKESANVAFVIFVLHSTIVTVLLLACAVYVVLDGGETMYANFSASDMITQEANGIGYGYGFVNLMLGVCTAMLGITGFETSSNYIEEQKPGVFAKTLRNMWIMVMILNPCMSLLSLGVLPMQVFHDHPENLLNILATMSVGKFFRLIVSVDAVLALSGGALTAYIGVNGLVIRLTEEGMLPTFFMARNRWNGTYHNIVLGFLIMTSTLYAMTEGVITALAGVYTISFLGVLLIATLGCVAIRTRKVKKQGSGKIWTWEIAVALAGVFLGVVGQVAMAPKNFSFFTYYFAAFMVFIVSYLSRRSIFEAIGVPQ